MTSVFKYRFLKPILKLNSALIWRFYASSSSPAFRRFVGCAVVCWVMVPGAVVGGGVRAWGWGRGRQPKGMLKVLLDKEGGEGGGE